jgi:hypothetical protein
LSARMPIWSIVVTFYQIVVIWAMIRIAILTWLADP